MKTRSFFRSPALQTLSPVKPIVNERITDAPYSLSSDKCVGGSAPCVLMKPTGAPLVKALKYPASCSRPALQPWPGNGVVRLLERLKRVALEDERLLPARGHGFRQREGFDRVAPRS